MESRKITVVSTKSNKKTVFNSTATTLRELKEDLIKNDVDFSEMSFYEGLSRTELKSDDSILPKDIEYKGKVTNDLVFMLTKSNKNIKSGAMSRNEIYNFIQVNNLQDKIKRMYGRSYTNMRTSDLEEFVSAEKKMNTNIADKPAECTESTNNNSEDLDCIRRALLSLYEDMAIEGYTSSETDALMEKLSYMGAEQEESQEDSQEESPYSSDEIDDMFDGIC